MKQQARQNSITISFSFLQEDRNFMDLLIESTRESMNVLKLRAQNNQFNYFFPVVYMKSINSNSPNNSRLIEYNVELIAHGMRIDLPEDVYIIKEKSNEKIYKVKHHNLRIGSFVSIVNDYELIPVIENNIPSGIISKVLSPSEYTNGNISYNSTVVVELMTPDLMKKYEKMKQRSFKINEFLWLKLENGKTNIYVKGIKFRQCMFLLLNLEEGNSYDEINSIDEAAKKLNRKNETDKSILTPEEEFRGHCSNLQAWYENDYDLRIIHTNLGFPLLKRLIEVGDKKALYTYKEELMFRIEEGGFNAISVLRTDIMKYFTKEEKQLVIDSMKDDSDTIDKLIKSYLAQGYNKNDNWRWSEEYMQEPDNIPPVRPVARNIQYHESDNVFQIAAGMSQDDDMTQSGDYLATISHVIRECMERGIENPRIKIISDPETYHQAMLGNHFYTKIGITEVERVLSIQDERGNNYINEWLVTNEFRDYRMVFQIHYRDRSNIERLVEFKTGNLWLV